MRDRQPTFSGFALGTLVLRLLLLTFQTRCPGSGAQIYLPLNLL
jgi:hypothetical protein